MTHPALRRVVSFGIAAVLTFGISFGLAGCKSDQATTQPATQPAAATQPASY